MKSFYANAMIFAVIIGFGTTNLRAQGEKFAGNLRHQTIPSQNIVIAEKAFQYAKTARNKGDLNYGLIFTLNALHHNPANITYIRFYRDLIANSNNLTDIEQFIAILDLAVYQVIADHVEEIIKLKNEMEEKRDRLNAILSESKKAEREKQEWNNIKKLERDLSLAKIVYEKSIDIKKLCDRIELLNVVLPELAPDSKEFKEFSKELQIATSILSISTSLKSVQKILNNIDQNKNKVVSKIDFFLAKAQIQSVSSNLVQAWSVDKEIFPENVKKIIETNIKECIQRLMDIEEAINVIASKSAEAEIKRRLSIIKEIYDYACKTGKLHDEEKRINDIRETASPINGLMLEIYSTEIRKNLISETSKISEYITWLSNKKFKREMVRGRR